MSQQSQAANAATNLQQGQDTVVSALQQRFNSTVRRQHRHRIVEPHRAAKRLWRQCAGDVDDPADDVDVAADGAVMSITGPGSITAANILAVNNMTKQLDTLTAELGSGQAAQTYSGLGSQAGLALSLNQQLAAITAYGNTATTVGTTLTVAQSVLSQLDGSRNSVIQAVGQQGTFALNGNGQTTTQAAAASQLGEILSLLNTQVGNNYIFSGSATTTPSVASSDEILNGNGAQAGLVQVINERLQADVGTGSGRLVVGGAGSSVSLADDSATSPFGFKVASITSNLTGATVTSSSPPSVAVNLGANPNAGDTHRVRPDACPTARARPSRCRRPRTRRQARTSSPSAPMPPPPRAICRPRCRAR